MYMYFSTFIVYGTVTMTTNYEETQVGPCPDELIVVTCSVVGFALRWIIVDTSLNITSLREVRFSARSGAEGSKGVISTSTIDLVFYQNETVRNYSDLSSSTITSEMYFHLPNANEFVIVQCADHSTATITKNITSLGTCMCCKTDLPVYV